MRIRQWISLLLLALTLMLGVSAAVAQSPTVEWTAWNTQITAHENGAPLDIAETQIIDIVSGQIHAGQRDFSQPVNIQTVFVAMNGSQPQQLRQGNGPGTYQTSQTSDGVLLDYELPAAANAGDSVVVQINFTSAPPASGLIDWYIVPAGHGAVVQSSRATLNFPDGQAPDPSFVRVPEGSGTVSVSGSSIIVQSNGALQPGQAFEIQAPFGATVGEPANPASNPVSPVQPAPVSPTAPSASTGIDLGGILPILCIIGVVLLIGGGKLLPSLLGGFLGSGLGRGIGGTSSGGFFGGGSNSPTSGGGFFGGSSSGSSGSSGRGFRASSNQNRSVPTVRSDKRRGGGSSFK